MTEIIHSDDYEMYKTIYGWLMEYQGTQDTQKRAKYRALIVTRMLPVIKKIAHTIARRSYDPIEDMVQAGSIGLLRAIDSFSDDKKVYFRIYAGHCIIGEMKHYLRDKLNSIKVPRHIQELVYRINTFTSSLTQEELHSLTKDDVAEALNVPSQVIDYAMEADRRTSVISFEDLTKEDDHSLKFEDFFSNVDYNEVSDMEDTKLAFKTYIGMLPDDCKQVVELYYYKDMNQKEIAAYLNINPMKISRKLKKAFSILSKFMADINEDVNGAK